MTSKYCAAALVASVLVLTLSLHVVHADDNKWQQLLKPHPRLVVTDDGLAKLKTLITQDAGAAAVYASVLSTGKSILKTAIIQCPKLLPGQDMLLLSRQVLNDMYTLGLLYRLNMSSSEVPAATWADHAIKELLSVTGPSCSTWNPAHYLDVAEMTHAAAIGYDWFFEALSASEKSAVEAGIAKLGMQTAMQGYSTGAWWWKADMNWNLVCNGGNSIGALAIGDLPQYQNITSQVMTNAMTGIPFGMKVYSPNGAWPEGTSYWAYATRYWTAASQAYSTATGTDNGLAAYPGLNKTAQFYVQSFSTYHDWQFDWADSFVFPDAHGVTSLFWLGSHYPRGDAYTYVARMLAINDPKPQAAQYLPFYSAAGGAADLADLPFRGTLYPDRNLALLRASPQLSPVDGGSTAGSSAYVAFKGGCNSYTHSHLDLGSFILTTANVSWAIDLGAGNYSLDGYFNVTGPRWQYYRTSNLGHNTLTFTDTAGAAMIQNPLACADIVAFQPIDAATGVGNGTVELADAYSSAFEQPSTGVTRSFVLTTPASRGGKTTLVVNDVLDTAHLLPSVANVTWALHTRAHVVLGLRGPLSATLIAGENLFLELSADDSMCPGATLQVVTAVVPPPQLSNEGVFAIQVIAPARSCAQLTVMLGYDS